MRQRKRKALRAAINVRDEASGKVKTRTLLRTEECGTLNVKSLRSEDLSYIKSSATKGITLLLRG